MTAEQWLADLEDTAKMVMDRDSFAVAVPPATVLRLVAMVRWLAGNTPGVVRPCPGYSRKCFLGVLPNVKGTPMQSAGLRLRKQVEELTNIRDIQLQEMAVDMLNEVIHDKTGEDIKAFSLGATCPHCNMQFATMREAIEHDAACPKHPATIRAERLEKEADWLAENCSRLEREANWLAGSLPIGAHGSCDDARKRWRDVARKAVEEKL